MMMAVKGRKQSAEHVAKRVAAVAAARAAWTDEQRAAFAEKIRKANAARPDEMKRRFVLSRIGKPGPHKGKKAPVVFGERHGMYDRTHTPESREKMRQAKLGKKQPEEHVQKRVAGRAGYRHSDEVKARIRTTNKKTWRRHEIKSKVSGPNSPAWLGGKSFEPYPLEWTSELKERVRDRDHRCCRACGKPEDENRERLCIHHVDYDKSNLSETNLVSVCKSCHGKTNYNRNEWATFFTRQFVVTQPSP